MATKQPKIKGRWSNDYKTKLIETTDNQNEVRRAAKRRPKGATGLATLAADPNVGATKAAREQRVIEQHRCEKITAMRQVISIFALNDHRLQGLSPVAYKFALDAIEAYGSTPVGTKQDPKAWIMQQASAKLSDHDKGNTGALKAGKDAVLKALDTAFNKVHQGLSSTQDAAQDVSADERELVSA